MAFLGYRNIDRFKYWFIITSFLMVLFFLWYSNLLVDKLSEEERVRAEIWAAAVKDLASSAKSSSVELASLVITSNTTIPVILTDSLDNLIAYNNFEPAANRDDSLRIGKTVKELRNRGQFIEIPLGRDKQYLYYDESSLLKALARFPYVQLSILMIFISIAFIAFSGAKKAEQRQVWAGLTKETAHQLGTPISSLMALSELLKISHVSPSVVEEMDKDVNRLRVIADRFSKVGSRPKLESVEADQITATSVEYIKSRVSSEVDIVFLSNAPKANVSISIPLYEWVIENLLKNAVDAMDGKGKITISTEIHERIVYIDVTDTGKGVDKKHRKMIFYPGFTTKKRGWGLGLTLARRIVCEFFGGKIYVKSSGFGEGTVFRIELPLYTGV